MSAASLSIVGNQQVAFYGLPDTTQRHALGTTITLGDPYWGGFEAIYVYSTGTIRQGGIITITPTFQTNKWRWDAAEVPNTANLGKSVYVAPVSSTAGQYFWAINYGIVPVNCTASVAADTAFGIVAAGQGGAIANGKQVLNARVIAPATTTVAKTNCTANSGSTRLSVPSVDGWFAGAYLSGTGIAALTTVTDIDPSGNIVTLSVATSAAVTGTVTATYNNATVYYNLAFIDRPLAQGQVT